MCSFDSCADTGGNWLTGACSAVGRYAKSYAVVAFVTCIDLQTSSAAARVCYAHQLGFRLSFAMCRPDALEVVSLADRP